MSSRSNIVRATAWVLGVALLVPPVLAQDQDARSDPNTVFTTDRRTIVTNQAMGSRCAVAADFDGDGMLDIVSASSNDNAVSWFKNLGGSPHPEFSIKKKITWSSLGSRIVTAADIDGDGDQDVVGASYYDSSLRWFENDGTGVFTEHLISSAVNEGQGVAVADLDNDGDPDIATASSGDNTIAVFKNIGVNGTFCEIKEVVDDNAIGARTVVAADLNGDGWADLASASKDDDTVAWYPNDGTGHFPTKIIVSQGEESTGAYSLVAADVDKDGHNDLVVASNGNDHVSLWRNDGTGNFTKTLIYDSADFVLSVTAVDFDHDGDIDVASASFFDGYIRWYENLDGQGYEWQNHTIYVGVQGHYVSHGDMDGDGDDDLIAVTHAENTVQIFYAETECDALRVPECCQEGTQWNGTACALCPMGTYGVGNGVDARCEDCPINTCIIPGRKLVPPTCGGITGCSDIDESLAMCFCPEDSSKDPATDTCVACPEGQVRPDIAEERGVDTLGNYTAWEEIQGICAPRQDGGAPLNIITPVVVVVGLLLIGLTYLVVKQHHTIKYRTRDVNTAPKDGVVALVFTDIEGSTALWDASKDTMSKALEIHHNVVRKVIDRHQGYEVKTIGDAFMIALGSADAAVRIANDIQMDLLAADWPIGLADMPSACTEFATSHSREKMPRAIFRGLRVRIGVHLGQHAKEAEEGGQVQIQYDDVTKGYDYYGPAVNATARIEALGFGGQTLISSEIITRLSDEVKNDCMISVVGGLDLKGVSEEVFLYQCFPKQLKGRRFRGVFRRRDSDGGSIVRDDDAEFKFSRGSIHDEDRNVDIMTLTPVQLQSMVLRLRSKLTTVESLVDESTYRRSSSKASWGFGSASSNLSSSDHDKEQDPKDGDKRFAICDEERLEQFVEEETRSSDECGEEKKQ